MRLLSPDFINFLCVHDICIFVETKLTDLDDITLPKGYTYVTKNRQKFKKASGGIIVIYKKELEKQLKFHISDCQFVLWFKISKSALSLISDVLFGCVYIPPENSKYSNVDAFIELENELVSLLKNERSIVALIGDFNSKTGVLPDFTFPDESINIFDLDYDAEILEYLYDFEKLLQNDIPLQRVSECTCRPNNYGHRLLEICKNNNIYIANSRIGLDKGKGEKTCNDVSVVDYLLLSSLLFPLVTDFKINDFVPLFSDCHSSIQFSVRAKRDKLSSPFNNIENVNPTFIRWKNDKRSEFVDHIHSDPNGILSDIVNKIDDLSAISNTVTNNDINDIVSRINKNFTLTAEEIFGKIEKRMKYTKQRFKTMV